MTNTLAVAFDDDPPFAWAFPDARQRRGHLRRYFAARLKTLMPLGLSWTSSDCSGAAVWASESGWHAGRREVATLAPMVLARRGPQLALGSIAIQRAHPREPHLYLAALGVAARGRGMGSALLERGLKMCDESRLPAYLETAKRCNLELYRRHGFRVRDQLHFPGGPVVWLMWREPR